MDRNHSPTVAVAELDVRGSVGHFDDRDASGGMEGDVAQRLDSVGGLLAELEGLDGPRLETLARRAGVSRAITFGDCQLGGWRASPEIDDADPFDWLSIAEGPTVLALGTSNRVDRCVALPRTLMRWAMRAHLDSHTQCQRLSCRLSSSLESVLRNSADATLFCATIAPLDRAVYCASVGHVTALRLHESGCQPLVGETRPFAGPGSGGRFVFFETRLEPGETLLAASVAGGSRWMWEKHGMFQELARHRDTPADNFASLIGQRIVRELVGPGNHHDGVAVVVAKRLSLQGALAR